MLKSGCSEDALGVEQQLGAGVEHAQVAEHLPLGREERGRSRRGPRSAR